MRSPRRSTHCSRQALSRVRARTARAADVSEFRTAAMTANEAAPRGEGQQAERTAVVRLRGWIANEAALRPASPEGRASTRWRYNLQTMARGSSRPKCFAPGG
jgi:hypothetical protein